MDFLINKPISIFLGFFFLGGGRNNFFFHNHIQSKWNVSQSAFILSKATVDFFNLILRVITKLSYFWVVMFVHSTLCIAVENEYTMCVEILFNHHVEGMYSIQVTIGLKKQNICLFKFIPWLPVLFSICCSTYLK